MASEKNTVTKVLHETLSGSSLFPNHLTKVITTTKDETVPQAFQKLHENKILSMPVLNNDGSCTSVLTVMDLLAHMLNNFSEENVKNVVKHTFDYFSMKITEKEISQSKLSTVKELGQLENLFTVKTTSPLYQAVKLMVENRAHRVLVVDEQNKFSNIITQSRVVQLFSMVLDSMPYGTKSLTDLKLGFKEVSKVSSSTTTYDAFKQIKTTNHSSIAVVDENGVLVGNISVSDIKLIGSQMDLFDLFAVPVSDYMKEVKERSRHQSSPVVRREGLPIFCRPHDTFGYVIKTLQHYRVHRLYIVDDNQKPIGVVSLHDVLQEVLKQDTLHAKH